MTNIEQAIEEEVQRRVDAALEAPLPKVLTVPEACTQLRVSKSTLYAMIRDGELVPSRLTRRVLIPATEIARVLDVRGSAA
jgi:excisionase family DNA binding protein